MSKKRENVISLKSVNDLCGMKFFIPSYQRGYRWNRTQVLDLLNDINEFDEKRNGFYCLQPLVVKRRNEDILNEIRNAQTVDEVETLLKGSWEVIDGQQRLTTLYIILLSLNVDDFYKLEYETRKDSASYISRIEKSKSNDNIDYYHISQAKDVVEEWLETHPEINNNKAIYAWKILEKTQFIWYESCEEDPIQVFTRLNIGKISLTNAELIKALLLKRGNFDGDSVLMQKNIAIEWARMENTFNDDAFWRFIRPMDDNRETRIDFLFEIIKAKNLLKYEPTEETGNDQYTTFRYFYGYFKQYKERAFKEIWHNVNTIYNILMHWYNEIELYHYVGFLLQYSECINDLIGEWLEPGTTVDDFNHKIKSKINDIIKQSGCNNLSKQYKYADKGGTDKTACTPILLLFNIQRIIILNRNLNKGSDTQIFNKFPFYLFKEEIWNVEHIASNTENDLSQTDAKKNWLKTFVLDPKISSEILKKIKDYIDNPEDEDEFKKLQDYLEKEQSSFLQEEEQLNDAEKNQIWNFCLLDEHTNKGYGNSIFPVKRRIIMGKEMGKKYILNDDLQVTVEPNCIAFVPECTKNAFIKAYTASDTSNREWSKTDAKAYRQEMYDCLKEGGFEVSI